MKNKSIESIANLNQFAVVFMVKKLKICILNNSFGEEMKKNLLNLKRLENFENISRIFHRNQRLQKA